MDVTETKPRLDDYELLKRITVRSDVFGGKPIIRDMRFAVEHVLGMLAAGDSVETILDEYEIEILQRQRLALDVGVNGLGHRVSRGACHDCALEPMAALKIGYASGSGPVLLMTRGMKSSLGTLGTMNSHLVTGS